MSSRQFQRGFLKLTKRGIATILICITLFVGTGLIFLFNPFGGVKEAEAAWIDDNWAYRKALTIDESKVSGSSNLTNFPILVSITDANAANKFQSDGDDILFVDWNSKKLDHELESVNSATGVIVAWVKIPSLPSTTNSTIYMYYGNPSSGNQQKPRDVWDSNYKMVQHMEETGLTDEGTSVTHTDSTSNFHDGTQNGNDDTTSGKVDGAQSFDGTDDSVNAGSASTLDNMVTGGFTIEAWINPANVSGNDVIVSKGVDENGSGWTFYISGSALRFIDGYASTTLVRASNSSTITASAWNHVVLSWDGSTTAANADLFVNGTEVSYATTTNGSGLRDGDAASDLQIGRNHGVWNPFNGTIDEVRISTTNRSADWILTSYNSQNSPSTFYTTGTEEKAPSPVAYWKFDDGTGTTAQDTTTGNYDGTLVGTPDWRTDDLCISGKCLEFDGNGTNDDRVYSVLGSSIPTGDFTYSAWVKLNATNANTQPIFSAEEITASGDTDELQISVDNSVTSLKILLNGVERISNTTTSLTLNQWTQVTVTRSGSTITVYFNGVPDATTGSYGSALSFASTCNLYIGIDAQNGCDESGGTFNDNFDGTIDEVKVYNQALTAAQIKANYNARGNPEGVSTAFGANTQNMPGALSNGLVGYWKMDESSWTNNCSTDTVTDSSGNGSNGDACPNSTGPTGGAVGKFGNAGSFDGSNDYVSVADSPNWDFGSNEFTVSWWEYRTANTNGKSTFVRDTSNPFPAYLFGYSSNGANLQVYMTSSGSSWDISGGNSLGTVSLNQWVHLAVTRKGNTFYTYKNGVQQDSWTSSLSLVSSALPMHIGGLYNSSGSTYYYSGSLDEVRFYNRGLSGAEVAQLYNWAPGPVGYWKMDENTGQTAYDASGNANNGTLGSTGSSDTNDPTWSSGRFGGGLNFDNTNDYLDGGSGSTLDDLPDKAGVTATAWIYPTSDLSNDQIVIKASGVGPSDGWLFQSAGSGSLLVQADFSTTGMSRSCNTNLPVNTWTHVAFTWTGSATASTVNIYANGSLLSSCSNTNGSGTSDTDAAQSINIGGHSTGNDLFPGKIDDVKVYDYVRTASQIIEDMNGGHPAPGSPVSSAVGIWRFDEGADDTCSGGSNDICNEGSGGISLDGTLTTTSRTTSGKFGSAFDGNGGARRGVVADNESLDFIANEDLSVSLWMKSDAAAAPANGNEYLVYKKSSATLNTVGYTLYTTQTTGTVCFGIDDDTTSFPEDSVCSTTNVYDSNWHHIAASLNRSGGNRLDLYVDGKPNGTADTSISATGTLANAGDFYIGDQDTDNNATANTEEFAGNIDSVKLFRSALTASQVAADINRGASQVLGALSVNSSGTPLTSADAEYCIPGDSASCNGPTVRYDLDKEGTFDELYDTSGNNRTAALGGSASLVPGKVGKGWTTTDPTNDFFEPTSAMSNFISATAGTMEVWVKFSGTASSVSNPSDARNVDAVIGDYNTDAAITRGTVDGADRIWFYNVDGTLDTISTTYSTGVWYHLAWVHTGGTLYAYKNGVLVGSTSSGNTSDLTGNFRVGGGLASGIGTNGIIDQVRTFNYGRSAAQIAWDYNKGGPVAHWDMDECQGTTINDRSGNSYTGTLTVGGTGSYTAAGTCTSGTSTHAWYNGATGKRNSSIALDGTNDYIQVSHNSVFDFGSNDFSIGMWVKFNAITTEIFIEKFTESTGPGWSWYYFLGNLEFFGCNNATCTSKAYTFNTGQWYYLTLTKSGSTYTTYVNGISLGTSTNANAITSSTNGITIGERDPSSGTQTFPFNGQLDDVKIFRYPLTAAQVKTLYNDGAIRFGPSTGAP